VTVAPAYPGRSASGRWAGFRTRAGSLVAGALNAVRASAAPAAGHLRDHIYTILGFGCVSAASFLHSVFTGLIVTGVLLLAFEWKVSE
jgi:hypothetical protein